MARGRKRNLSKVELYFIQGHLDSMTAREIADEFGLESEVHVQEVMNEMLSNRLPNSYDLMTKKKNRAVIMTQEASMRGDDARQPIVPSKDGVYVIKKNRQ